MTVCHSQPAEFEFYDPQSPIYTSPRVLPPATVENCKVTDAIVAQGAYMHDATVANAVIGLRAVIGKGCTIQVRADCCHVMCWRQRVLVPCQDVGDVGLGAGT